MEQITEAHEDLALKLWGIGAVELGPALLKHHEKNPQNAWSPIFFNIRQKPKGPLTYELVEEVASSLCYTARSNGILFSCVAGVPHAGDPIAEAFARTVKFLGRRWVSLRDIPVLHLEKRDIGKGVGRSVTRLATRDFSPGATVLLIDDVITRGESKLEAIRVLLKEGLVIRDVLVLVDREQGGREMLERVGCRLHAVFTLRNFLLILRNHNKISEEKYNEVLEYLEFEGSKRGVE